MLQKKEKLIISIFMFIRVIFAFVGGYILAIVLSLLFSHILTLIGVDKANATLWAQLVSFLIYACILMWFFAIKSLKKITLYYLLILLISGILIFLLRKFAS